MKIFTSIILSIVLFFGLLTVSTVRAEGFTVSGVLKMTDPANNPYSANYLVQTPSGGKFYFKLNKAFYGDWVEKNVYFHVNGDFQNFVVKSSGIGVRDNTYKIPETGSGITIMALVSLFLAGHVLIQNSKIKISDHPIRYGRMTEQNDNSKFKIRLS